MANTAPKSSPASPEDPIDLTTSVAGEEDPGASIDLSDKPAFPMKRPEEGPAREGGEGEGAV